MTKIRRQVLIGMAGLGAAVLLVGAALFRPAAKTALGPGDPGGVAEPPAGQGEFPSTLERRIDAWRQVEQALTPPPKDVRGIYLTANTAGSRARVDQLLGLLERTELNAMVIDVKDDSGVVTYRTQVPQALEFKSWEAKIEDLPGLIARLKERDVYLIARLVTFKDPVMSAKRPELAVASTRGGIWRDRKGIGWLDPYRRENWAYALAVAREAAALGFDEIQFDYVRFPSDGDRSIIRYPGQDERPPAQVIADFLAYAREELAPFRVRVSADIFGLVTTFTDDMGIGQNLEAIAPNVDVISPMVYPSHYAPYNYGLPNPNAQPYETVRFALTDAMRRLEARGRERGDADPTATARLQLRPWLQDFSLGYPYGPAEVRAQIEATEEFGIRQWLLWNPANKYTEAALRPAGPSDTAAGP